VSDTTRHWCEGLYESQAAQFVLYGRALGLSHSEAEDVLHETFAALLRLEQAPEEPVYYSLRSFRNRAFNHRRSLWRRLAREPESRRWFEREEGESAEERAAMRALARLPREQREVIVLKIWHGHTFEAIGTLLEASPNTVAGRYRYGIQKLRNSLKEQAYERLDSTGESTAFLETSPALGEG
jgi:RNA polymerase sigma-70 factor, ECF subfamily